MPISNSIFTRNKSWAMDRDNSVKITAARHDDHDGDIATALNAIMAGTAGFIGPTLHYSGSAALPGIAFNGDTDTGIYRIGANQIGFATAGVLAMSIDAAGVVTFANTPTAPTATAGTSTTQIATTAFVAAAKALKGHIYGLTLSNNSTDATNDIDIAAGEAVSTETSPGLMVLASALTKRLDATWAVGTNQGMLDGTESVAGTPDVSTWYHIWLIERPDTGVVDVLASESATAPTMPDAAYTRKRRIGAVFNDASGDILAFTQFGDEFLLNTSTNNYDQNNPGVSAVSVTLTVPTGVKVVGKGHSVLVNANVATGSALLLSALDRVDETPSSANMINANAGTFAGGSNLSGLDFAIRTSTAGQIRTRVNFSSTDVTLRIRTIGWIDTRGRLA